MLSINCSSSKKVHLVGHQFYVHRELFYFRSSTYLKQCSYILFSIQSNLTFITFIYKKKRNGYYCVYIPKLS